MHRFIDQPTWLQRLIPAAKNISREIAREKGVNLCAEYYSNRSMWWMEEGYLFNVLFYWLPENFSGKHVPTPHSFLFVLVDPTYRSSSSVNRLLGEVQMRVEQDGSQSTVARFQSGELSRISSTNLLGQEIVRDEAKGTISLIRGITARNFGYEVNFDLEKATSHVRDMFEVLQQHNFTDLNSYYRRREELKALEKSLS